MTRKQMSRESMQISEEWRWRLLTIWVIFFTLLCSYVLFKVRDLSNENRDALCAIRTTHVITDNAIKQLLERGGMDVGEITRELEQEERALMELGC